jgi:hypothetical protein
VAEQGREERHRVVDYIAAMLAQLAQMAGTERHTTLAYLLEMARLEAEHLRNSELIEPDRQAAE